MRRAQAAASGLPTEMEAVPAIAPGDADATIAFKLVIEIGFGLEGLEKANGYIHVTLRPETRPLAASHV
jgi:hypothetical protein